MYMKKIVFLGCCWHFKRFSKLACDLGYEIVGIIDDHYYGNTLIHEGIPIIQSEKNIVEFLSLCSSDIEFFISTPLLMRDTIVHTKRLRMIDIVNTHDLPCVNLIDPFSSIGVDVVLGKGIFLAPFSVVQDGARLDDHVWVQEFGFVGHDSKVGTGTSLSVKAYLGSINIIGKNSLIGINSCVIHRMAEPVTIGDNSMTHPGVILMDDLGSNLEACINRTVKPRPF